MRQKFIKHIILLLFITFSCVPVFAAQGPIEPSRIELHHIFPKNEEMRSYFLAHGIEPDLYCIPLPRSKHILRGGESIHTMRFMLTGGQNYIQSWRTYIALNSQSSKTMLFAFGSSMIAEFAVRAGVPELLGDIKLKQYLPGKDVDSGETIFIGKQDFITRTQEYLKNKTIFSNPKLLSLVKNTAILATSAFILYEIVVIYNTLEKDISVSNEYVQIALDCHIKSLEFYRENREKEAIDRLADAFFYLGYAYFGQYLDRQSALHKKIADWVDKKSEHYLFRALLYFEQSKNLNPGNQYALFYFAKTSILRKEHYKDDIIECLNNARELFIKDGSANSLKFVELIDLELSRL